MLILSALLTGDHLAVIRAVTPEERRFAHARAEVFRGPAVVALLCQLLRQLPGKLLLIWDGSSIHHGRTVKHFLAASAAKHLHLERLAVSALDLNPGEGVSNLLKRREPKNRCCQDLAELRWELGLALRRLRRRAYLPAACFRQCGYVQ